MPPQPDRDALWIDSEIQAWAATLITVLPDWPDAVRHPYCADDAHLITALAWGCYMAATAPRNAVAVRNGAISDRPLLPIGFDDVRALCETLFALGVQTGRQWPDLTLDP